MRYVMLVMAMILTFDLGTAQATSLDERESLRGLPGVAVVIENISPDVQAVGLTEEAVQTDVELILQSSGIRVFTIVEIANMPSKPFLYVGITLRNGSVYSYYINVSFRQQVSLVRNPQYTMFAATWEDKSVGTVGKGKLRSSLSKHIERMTKAFANDFLAVNPR